jgi:hypothetical protein
MNNPFRAVDCGTVTNDIVLGSTKLPKRVVDMLTKLVYCMLIENVVDGNGPMIAPLLLKMPHFQ